MTLRNVVKNLFKVMRDYFHARTHDTTFFLILVNLAQPFILNKRYL